MQARWLVEFWAAVVAFAILMYVILDGYDLGVGMLFGTTRDESHRVAMMGAIAPYWDGNETWLVLIGTILFAAFPTVYAIFLPAFYTAARRCGPCGIAASILAPRSWRSCKGPRSAG